MLVVVRVALVARRQMECLVLAPPRSLWFGCWERSTPPWLDHPLDHPDDPTGSVWSRLDRRRAPAYGSGGWGFKSLAARQKRRSEAEAPCQRTQCSPPRQGQARTDLAP